MASNHMKNRMKRMESRKSHSWWWDSHISPKNSKWLQENLEEMDEHVKRMLKLIEEDADSFAKKAEMYYQKRPELIKLVEDFYRMYRSLAERYDHLTGELRKNVPSDLQSQSSGISDVGSEPPSSMPSPDRRPISRSKSGPRAAGFDFFLGNGGSDNKEGDESSTLDSESDSDNSSVNNYSGNDEEQNQGLRRKIIELEVELREVKEKLQMHEELEISEEGLFRKSMDDCSEGLIARYEEELRAANEKIQESEEEISRLMIELEKYKSLGAMVLESSRAMDQNHVSGVQESMNDSEAQVMEKNQTLGEELRITKEKFHESEEEIAVLRQALSSKGSTIQNLEDELKSTQKELYISKNKFEKENKDVLMLQDRVERYKTSLSEREQEIRGLKEAISNANKSLSEENEQLQAEISRILKEQAYLEDKVKELDLRCQSLEEDLQRVKAGKTEMEVMFGTQIELLKADISYKNGSIEELKKSLEALRIKHDVLIVEKGELSMNIDAASREMRSKNDQIDEMSKHLHQLHMEHVHLIAGAGGAQKLAADLRSRIKELEREAEIKEELIVQGAEEKREAIRQLCFSLEHYRNVYHRLRQAVVGNRRLPVMAT